MPPFDLASAIVAAESGDANAMASVGGVLVFSPPELGNIVDLDQAEYWLLKAAEHGKTSAYNRLYHASTGQPDVSARKGLLLDRKGSPKALLLQSLCHPPL